MQYSIGSRDCVRNGRVDSGTRLVLVLRQFSGGQNRSGDEQRVFAGFVHLRILADLLFIRPSQMVESAELEVGMKLVIFIILAVFLPMTLCEKANAQNATGMEIQKKCKLLENGNANASRDDAADLDAGYCAGFMDGVVETEKFWDAFSRIEKSGHPLTFCIPQDVTNGQILQVFLKYLDDHPEELNKPAALLFAEALNKAFPCGK